MKTLLLMRHAKSDWSADFDRDEERPLDEQGRLSAARAGRWLTAVDRVPDRVVCSPAVRTRSTAERAVEAGSWRRPLDVDQRIYDADPRALMQVLASTDESAGTLLLVGHEPGLSGTLAHLLGGAALRVPPAAIACLELDLDSWADLEGGCGTLLWLVPPDLLAG